MPFRHTGKGKRTKRKKSLGGGGRKEGENDRLGGTDKQPHVKG